MLLAVVPAGGFDALSVRAASDKAPAGRFALLLEEMDGGPDLALAFARHLEGSADAEPGAGKERLKASRAARD
ncbi:MAG TPA: hypothetical protein VFD06_05185 [Candidatus Polarisedimenticolia bacterium]|nr:hypothetical protein [Candidatus Polarisedimenticolia bacterium]